MQTALSSFMCLVSMKRELSVLLLAKVLRAGAMLDHETHALVSGIFVKGMPWQHVTCTNQTKMAAEDDLDGIRAGNLLVFRR